MIDPPGAGGSWRQTANAGQSPPPLELERGRFGSALIRCPPEAARPATGEPAPETFTRTESVHLQAFSRVGRQEEGLPRSVYRTSTRPLGCPNSNPCWPRSYPNDWQEGPSRAATRALPRRSSFDDDARGIVDQHRIQPCGGRFGAISDSAQGAAPADRERIFGSFYTTWPAGWELASRYAAPSSMPMRGDCGSSRVSLAAPSFASHCPRTAKP